MRAEALVKAAPRVRAAQRAAMRHSPRHGQRGARPGPCSCKEAACGHHAPPPATLFHTTSHHCHTHAHTYTCTLSHQPRLPVHPPNRPPPTPPPPILPPPPCRHRHRLQEPGVPVQAAPLQPGSCRRWQSFPAGGGCARPVAGGITQRTRDACWGVGPTRSGWPALLRHSGSWAAVPWRR